MSAIEFHDQVAIVTGAAAGLGREMALALAGCGAAVVVNDYGGDAAGQGGSAAPAQAVAEEIRAAGGRAVACCEAVGSDAAARAIAAAALDSFGRIDILINNAGISAPGKLEDVDADLVERVLRVNLHGPFHLVRAVWPLLSAQRYGRILNVSSNAMLGIGTSTAYAAAKAGLIGLTRDTAQAGAALGIRVNALMPVAYTRMTQRIPDPTFREWMQTRFPPDKVAPAALWLVSRGVPANGEIFSAGGGRVARVVLAGTPGYFNPQPTPGDCALHAAEIMATPALTPLENNTRELHSYLPYLPWPEGRPLVVMKSVADD